MEYLALNNNKISEIENISHLKNLSFLKLNSNLIQKVNIQELPVFLEYLNLENNPI